MYTFIYLIYTHHSLHILQAFLNENTHYLPINILYQKSLPGLPSKSLFLGVSSYIISGLVHN